MLIRKLLSKKYWLLYPLLLLWSQPLYAESVIDIFYPKAVRDGTDKSIILLGQLFGTVDGVLHGFGSQIMGVMFGVFNSAVIGLGGLIILYTLVVSTLNTAQEGDYLGRRWSSMWIPIRSVVGIGLLLPKASGYSIVQIFVMWVVVQGVGAGDTIWNRAMNYIIHAGTIIPSTISGSDVGPIVSSAQTILQMQVCVAGMQFYWNQEHPQCSGASLYPSFPQLPTDTSQQYISQFPADASLPDACQNQHFQSNACGTLSFNKDADPDLARARLSAIWQMVLDLGAYATTMVQDPTVRQTKTLTDSTEAGMALTNATLDYIAILLPTLQRNQHAVNQGVENTLLASQDDGWILAGRYYELLAQLSGSMQNISSAQPSLNNPDVSKRQDGISQTSWNNIQNLKTLINASIVNIAKQKLASGASSANVSPDVAGIGGDAGGITTRVIIGIFTLGMLEWAHGAFADAFEQGNVDPIWGVIKVGNNLINAASTMWLVCGIILFVMAIMAVMTCAQPAYWMLLIFTVWFVPVASTIMVTMFTAGCVLAFYVPIVPFMIFFFGCMGWFLGVIESMVAAPLVALGIAHPDGQHEIFGRAEPAMMLLVNIFLRPSLMIVGFIVGILLSYIAIHLLNLGFGPAFRSLPTPSGSGFASAMRAFAVAIIYTALVVLIINKAFSAINEVPNKVLRWIGGQEQLGDSSADLGQVQGAVSGAASTFGEFSATAIKHGAEATQQLAKHKMDQEGGGLQVAKDSG